MARISDLGTVSGLVASCVRFSCGGSFSSCRRFSLVVVGDSGDSVVVGGSVAGDSVVVGDSGDSKR